MARRSESIDEMFASPNGSFRLRAEVVYERLPAGDDADVVSRYRVLVDGASVGEVWRVEFARRHQAKLVVRSVWRWRTANGTSEFVPRRSRRDAATMMLTQVQSENRVALP